MKISEDTQKYLKDLAERVIVTFAGGALTAASLPELMSFNMSVWQRAAFAGGVAVVSLFKGIVARYRGDPSTAQLTS